MRLMWIKGGDFETVSKYLFVLNKWIYNFCTYIFDLLQHKKLATNYPVLYKVKNMDTDI